MFKSLKTLHNKAQAADIVERFIKHVISIVGHSDLKPSEANMLIRAVYKKSPDVFNGNRGTIPHNVIFALRAFMSAASDTPRNEVKFIHYMTCLEQMLQDIEANQVFYSFTELDTKLLNEATIFFNTEFLRYQDSPAVKEMNEILENKYSTWTDWFNAFKTAANETNSEMLEVIPLENPSLFKDWFRQQADPIEKGKDFANNYYTKK